MSSKPQVNKKNQKQTTVKCPICGNLVQAEEPTFPFCSKRCRTIDLGKWLKGDYVISRPIEQSDLEEGE